MIVHYRAPTIYVRGVTGEVRRNHRTFRSQMSFRFDVSELYRDRLQFGIVLDRYVAHFPAPSRLLITAKR